MSVDLEDWRSMPQTEGQIKQLWKENFHIVTANGLNIKNMQNYLRIGEKDLVEETKSCSGEVYRDLKKLELRLKQLVAISDRYVVGRTITDELKPFTDLVDPKQYLDTSIIALHFIERMAYKAKVELQMPTYAGFAMLYVGGVYLAEDQKKRYASVGEGLNILSNRLASLDLQKFEGK